MKITLLLPKRTLCRWFHHRFTHAFTACSCVFKVITLVWVKARNFFENASACNKRMRKTLVATQLYVLFFLAYMLRRFLALWMFVRGHPPWVWCNTFLLIKNTYFGIQTFFTFKQEFLLPKPWKSEFKNACETWTLCVIWMANFLRTLVLVMKIHHFLIIRFIVKFESWHWFWNESKWGKTITSIAI